jgi:hypothetical protein
MRVFIGPMFCSASTSGAVRPPRRARARMRHLLRRGSAQAAATQSHKYPNRGASAIRSTYALWRPCHSLCAAERPANLITYVLPNPGRWAPNPAISGSCRSATRTTKRSTAPAMSRSGGKMPRLIPWLKPSGSGSITTGDQGRANLSSDSCMPTVLASAPLHPNSCRPPDSERAMTACSAVDAGVTSRGLSRGEESAYAPGWDLVQ